MLKGITWGEYSMVCGTLLLLYYSVVGLAVFGQDIATWIKKRAGPKSQEPEDFISSAQKAEELISTIKDRLIPQTAGDRSALKSSLKQLLQSQSKLNPTLKSGINQVIIANGFTAEEVAAIW